MCFIEIPQVSPANSRSSLILLPLQLPMAHTKTNKLPTARPNLTVSQKLAQREKFRALTDDINNARVAYTREVVAISKKHHRYVSYSRFHTIPDFTRSERWVCRQLYLGRYAGKKSRHPNAWNAFVHQRLNDINESVSFLLHSLVHL